MKYAKKLIWLLLAAVLAAGCARTPAAPTEPTLQTVIEPTQPVTQPPEDALAAQLQSLFGWQGDMFFNQAAGHSYTRAEDADLYYLFYNGFLKPEGFDACSEAEQSLWMAGGYGAEFDRQALPLDVMDARLRQYFGLGLEDVRMPDAWEYDPQTDSWYSDHPRPWNRTVTVEDYEQQPDGTVRLMLRVTDFLSPAQGVIRDAETVMTLRPAGDGWQILSNVQVDERTQQERLADYQQLFSGFYGMAAGHAYTRPEEADLYYLFYNGVGYPGSWSSISDAEQKRLESSGFWREMDIQIMPADMLEAQLHRYFGLELAEMKIPDEWVYSAATDTYYSNHNDAYGCGVTVTGFEDLPDGRLLLHLTVDMVHDHGFDEVIWDAAMDMTLRPVSDSWRIESNVSAGNGPAAEQLEYFGALLRWDSGYDYCRALGTIFNTTEDMAPYYFFYGGVDHPARWDELDSAERDFLLAAGLWEELELQKMPASLLEERLRQYFGIGLADVKIPDRWVYYPALDCYYTNHSDAWLPCAAVTDVEEFPDGTVRVYLTVDRVIDHTGAYIDNAETVLTLRRTADGSYQMVTHTFAQDVV